MDVHARDWDFVSVGVGGCADGHFYEGGGDDVGRAVGGGENETAGNYSATTETEVAEKEGETQANVGEEEGAVGSGCGAGGGGTDDGGTEGYVGERG